MYDFDAGVNAVGSASCAASTCQERRRQEAHNCCPAATEEGRQNTAAAATATEEGRQNTASTTSPTTTEGCGGGSTTATFAEEGGREPRWLVPAALPNEYDCATCCKSRIQTSNAASGEFRLIMPPKSDEEVAAIFSVGNKAASSPGTTKTPSEVSPGFLKVGGHLSTGTGCLSSVTSEENLRKFLLH